MDDNPHNPLNHMALTLGGFLLKRFVEEFVPHPLQKQIFLKASGVGEYLQAPQKKTTTPDSDEYIEMSEVRPGVFERRKK